MVRDNTSFFSSPVSTLPLPRLLFFHGGGSNSDVFRLQCRGLIQAFQPYFRCVFVDGPFISAPGPGVLPFFEGMEPFRRWLVGGTTKESSANNTSADGNTAETTNSNGKASEGVDRGDGVIEHRSDGAWNDDVVIARLESQCKQAMQEDDNLGATGEWVGLVGFSQGGKIAASILFDMQARLEATAADDKPGNIIGFAGGDWQFAILMAARESLLSLSKITKSHPRLIPAGLPHNVSWPSAPAPAEHRLTLPTIHVHGLKDWGLDANQGLYRNMCENEKGTARLVEWNGDHRCPVLQEDVKKVLEKVLDVIVDLHILKREQIRSDQWPFPEQQSSLFPQSTLDRY